MPDRTCANGIFYVLRTGCQWKALDATGICSGSTAHLRFQEWVADGVFRRLWQAGLERYDELKGLDWNWLSMDGALTKALLGEGKTGPNPTDRGQLHGPVSGAGCCRFTPTCVGTARSPRPGRTSRTVHPRTSGQ